MGNEYESESFFHEYAKLSRRTVYVPPENGAS